MRFALCIEASHKMGLGHLYRALNFADFLKSKNLFFVVFINDDKNATVILKEKNVNFEVVNLNDNHSNWEQSLVEKYNLDVWINDRLVIDKRHMEHLASIKVKSVTFDGWGSGAEYADLNICALPSSTTKELKGKKVLTGTEYLILNSEIDEFKRLREKVESIIVTLGGSDTYGSTVKVAKILKDLNVEATIVIGPSFEHLDELREITADKFLIKETVKSMIEEFSHYDLAITGGGITPFEANASGLPCIIIANEDFEVANGEFLDNLGSSKFAGVHTSIKENLFKENLDINLMSTKGLNRINIDGAKNILKEILSL